MALVEVISTETDQAVLSLRETANSIAGANSTAMGVARATI
jgi:hypothetical protein